MAIYNLNYLYPNQQMEDDLGHAEFGLSQSGVELEPTSGFRNTMRRYFYRKYLSGDVVGLCAKEFLFYMSTSYHYSRLVLGEEEILGITTAKRFFSPWERRETECVSRETVDIINFFLGKDVRYFQLLG